MENIKLARDLIADGFAGPEIARLAHRGELIRIRRGAYVDGPAGAVDARASHQLLVVATMRQLAKPATVSHVSAAAMHGLPVWPDALARVHLTRPDAQGRVRSSMHLHQVDLPAEETTLIDGCNVTSLARTVIDVARTEGFIRSVAAADAALARGLDASELLSVIGAHPRLHGVARARRVVAFADGRSESVGESCSRVVFHVNGVPAPTLQHEVRDEWGRFLGRSDFCWESRRVIGEFDGKVKYAALLRPGQSPSDVVVAEKVREDAIRAQGWQVMRWTWEDIFSPDELLRRLKRALAVRI